MIRASFSLTVSVSQFFWLCGLARTFPFLLRLSVSRPFSTDSEGPLSALCLQTFAVIDRNLIGEFFSFFSVSFFKKLLQYSKWWLSFFSFYWTFDCVMPGQNWRETRQTFSLSLLYLVLFIFLSLNLNFTFEVWLLVNIVKWFILSQTIINLAARCPNQTKKWKDRSNTSTTITFLVAYLS